MAKKKSYLQTEDLKKTALDFGRTRNLKVNSDFVLKLLQKCPSCEVIHFYRRATLKRESRMQALNLPWCWASHLQ